MGHALFHFAVQEITVLLRSVYRQRKRIQLNEQRIIFKDKNMPFVFKNNQSSTVLSKAVPTSFVSALAW